MEQYDDKGGFIEVLRVDRVQPLDKGEDLYQLKIRRKEQVVSNKTTN